MGNLLRQYWMPVLFSWELESDGPPRRMRLLGEDLIAFRDTSNQVGILGANCAHRGASLFFGRNEDCGLRCVYHGWKYDVSGQCVDMPNEPPESTFKSRVRALSYPCQERGGLIWTYMGPRSTLPPLPDLEFNMLPEDHVSIRKNLQDKAVLESMGPIVDRTHEHLGTTDLMIIQVRRRLIDAARALRDHGVAPPGVDDPDVYRVRTATAIVPKGQNWRDAAVDYLKAFTDLPVLSAEAQLTAGRVAPTLAGGS